MFLHLLSRELKHVPAIFVDGVTIGRRGDTVSLRLPVKFEPWAPCDEPIMGQYELVTLAHQHDTAVAFDDRDLALDLKTFAGLYLEPMARDLATKVLNTSAPPNATMVTAMQQVPSAVQQAATASDADNGISNRMISVFDAIENRHVMRADILFGFATKVQAQPRRGAFAYQITAEDEGAIALLMEAKAQLVAELQYRRAA